MVNAIKDSILSLPPLRYLPSSSTKRLLSASREDVQSQHPFPERWRVGCRLILPFSSQQPIPTISLHHLAELYYPATNCAFLKNTDIEKNIEARI